MTDRRAKWPISRCPLCPHPIKPGEWIMTPVYEKTTARITSGDWA